MKNENFFSPETHLNVLIACSDYFAEKGLYGRGTFPWDSRSKTRYGGIFLNSIVISPGILYSDSNFAHEVGHCLGLLHTFHGVVYVKACSECYERIHTKSDYNSNFVGDFCADTLATNTNDFCDNPLELDPCYQEEFNNTDYLNIMGYSTKDEKTNKFVFCRNEFSKQQILRMHCYVQRFLTSWLR